jgi:pimeloyl-ACP methyl ester carboxylesterase
MSERQLAATMHRLMTEVLGYERYVTYGEDVSANVNDLLASAHPETVQAIITTHAHFGTPEERRAHDEPEVTAFFARLARDHESEGAYGHVQATRPDTLAAALNDSPAGLVAWLVEKFVEWGDADTDVPAAVFIQRHEADYPEVLARDFYRDLRVFERLDRGGHFTVAERPHEMAERVRAFVATL